MIKNLHVQKQPFIITNQFFKNLFIQERCDCDACPAGIAVHPWIETGEERLSWRSSPVQSVAVNSDFNVVYGTHLTASPLVLNDSALTLLKYFEQPRTLNRFYEEWRGKWDISELESVLNTFLEHQCLLPQDTKAIPFAESLDTFTALLHLTTACNLSCDYCYVPEKTANMSIATGYRVIETIFRSIMQQHVQTLKLKYTGGEPLQCVETIQLLHQYAATLTAQHGIGLQGVILSNGTLLTPEIVEIINKLNLRLMISLDGIDDYHNCQRRFSDGKSSFEAVSRAINLALSRELTPDISITVSSRNVKGLPELMDWILARNLPFSLNFYREHERSKTHHDLALDEEKIIAGMLAAFRVIEATLPRRSLLASLVDRANLAMPHVRPCSVGHSYLVFDCEGRIFKCQMQMDRPVADISIADPLIAVQADTQTVQNIVVDEKEGCQSCQWKYWCAGGCPLATFRATGRYDVKSPNCNIYKALYPEVLRLEGLRMLKYASLSEN